MSMPGIPSPICVVIGRTRHKMVQAEIGEACTRGAEFIELRLDYLKKAPDFKRLLEKKPQAVVATVRRPVDGGRWAGSEDARQMLLRQAIAGGFDWVDLETDVIEKIPRYGQVKRIVSYHNVREVPDDLEKIHETMCKQDADVVKIAVRAQKISDNLRVLRLCGSSSKPTVAIAMGNLGIPSRLLALKLGSPFTYAAFNKERALAPGLLSFDEVRNVYDVERINSETQVFGVIGDPVEHSLSPLIHNRGFKELGLNAVYLKFRAPEGELEALCKVFGEIPVSGYSVTIPHKEAAFALAAEQDSTVARARSANTLVHQGNGTFRAYNTDYTGALESLRNNLPTEEGPVTFTSKAVLILGAGGVARSIAHALAREGALITISGRTFDRAHRLAEELQCRAVEWRARHSAAAEIVINCTPVGMHPNVDESPLHASFLKPNLVVLDTVYVPETTLLVRQARERNCVVVTGVDFFVRQAAEQFKLFTEQDPPMEVMRKVVKRALSTVRLKEDD